MSLIKIHEVGLRDGLQNVPETIPTETKIAWAKMLSASGAEIIQLGSFVNPKKVFQMADTDELFRRINADKHGETIFSGLILNEKGFERGMDCGVDMFCMGVSASETHSMKNTGMSSEEALTRIIEIAKNAMKEGKAVQCSVQSAFGCGFEGRIPEERVLKIVEKYFEAGINNISLADTAGHANPLQTKRLFKKLKEMQPRSVLACHFHNTYGMGMANCLASIESGAEIIETAFGGLGGCPFTKSPSGNVATEDFAQMLQEMGMKKDFEIEPVMEVSKSASEILGRELPGLVYKTGLIRDLKAIKKS